MGFFTGRASFQRFQIQGPAQTSFQPEHLERLQLFEAGRQRIASADGIEIGWSAGEHILDTDFQLEKNIIADTLNFDLRVDVDRLPSDMLKAYYAVELKALSANNPSGFPSARQKREARENARERLEQESKDGRYKKRKCIPVLWDGQSGELLFGTTALTQMEQLCSLFRQTFGLELHLISSGRRAYQLAEPHERTRNVEDASPSAFIPGVTPADLAWIADETCRDFLGNEFLLWLWFLSEGETDTLEAVDKSEITFMLARTLTLECPNGQTGHETITSEAPTRLPEARRAIQSGKWPRKAGMTLVRHQSQYELTFHAESFAIGSAKLPNPEEENPRLRLEERAGQLRHLIETLDLLYDVFAQVRFGRQWPDTLSRMQRWLKREERQAA